MTVRRVLLIAGVGCVGGLMEWKAAFAQCLPNAHLTVASRAADLPSSLGGGVGAPRAQKTRQMTEAQLLSLPTAVIETGTDWTSESRFEGPRLRDVLQQSPEHRHAVRSAINVSALNGYSVTIPIADMEKYEPILAHTRDGVRMKRSDFGPLFIVYPRDRYRELRAPNMAARMVWQVCRIDVE